MPTSPTGRAAGFTLLELLVALSISSLIMMTAYGTFATATRASRRVDAHARVMQNARHAFASIGSDVLNAQAPTLDSPRCSQWAGDRLVFAALDREGKRGVVSYAEKDDRLYRTWQPAAEAQPAVKAAATSLPVAYGLRRVSFEYLHAGKWHRKLDPSQWPKVVAVKLRLEDSKAEMTAAFRQIIRFEVQPLWQDM